MKKQLLLIIATHGNEPIGLEITKRLENLGLDKYFDILIANPEALKNKKRFMQADLNRSYPGQYQSSIYEKRIAFDNLKIAKKYQYIIDLHEASSGQDDFIIVPRERISKKFPITLINLNKVLLWPNPKGPISQILTNSIELEFGVKNKNRNRVISKATRILKEFITEIYMQKKLKNNRQQKIFYVYGAMLMKNNKIIKSLKDFRLTKINNESFYPLLTGQYIKEGIMCYKMKKRPI